jgi:hypothetical protein
MQNEHWTTDRLRAAGCSLFSFSSVVMGMLSPLPSCLSIFRLEKQQQQ